MLVWNHREETIQQREIVEWYKNEYGYVIWRDVNNTYWNYCAEIPKDEHVCAEIPNGEPAEDLNAHIERLKAENEELKNKVNELKNSSSYQTYCGMCDVIAKHEEKIARLEAENEETRLLKFDHHEMASTVSNAVWQELMDRAKDIEGPVNTRMVGFVFNDISDLVLNKILEYKQEKGEPIYKVQPDKSPEKELAENSPKKKYRRMTHRELAIWCAKGNGEWTNAGMRTAYQHYDYDIDEESEMVSEHIKIRACDETEWHEPLVEDSTEE